MARIFETLRRPIKAKAHFFTEGKVVNGLQQRFKKCLSRCAFSVDTHKMGSPGLLFDIERHECPHKSFRRSVFLAVAAALIQGPACMAADLEKSQVIGEPQWLPPATADRIRNADLIVIGTIRKFVFHGVDSTNLQQYGIDFAAENESELALHGFVSVDRILKNVEGKKIAQSIRIYYPAPRQDYKSFIGATRIFFLSKGVLLRSGDPSSRLYEPIHDSLPLSELNTVKEAIAANPVNK